MTEPLINLEFHHNYTVEWLRDLPGAHSDKTIYFPSGSHVGGKDGVWINVEAAGGDEWIGCFAFGYSSPAVLTAVLSCPNPDMLCVVASGQGYMVSSSDPSRWFHVESYPIVNAIPVPKLNLLVFVDFTTISAYGAQSKVWKTGQVSWDGIKVHSVIGYELKGSVWDAPRGQEVPLILDLRNGEVADGVRVKE